MDIHAKDGVHKERSQRALEINSVNRSSLEGAESLRNPELERMQSSIVYEG